MHAGLAGLRRVSPPGHLQVVDQRSRVARQPRAGGATAGAPAEQPVRSRGAFGDELRTPAPRANKQGGWPEPPDAAERERTERSRRVAGSAHEPCGRRRLSADAQRRLLDAAAAIPPGSRRSHASASALAASSRWNPTGTLPWPMGWRQPARLLSRERERLTAVCPSDTVVSGRMTTYEVLSLIVTGTLALAGLITAGAAFRSSTNVKRSLDIQAEAAREEEMTDRVVRRAEYRLRPGSRRRGKT